MKRTWPIFLSIFADMMGFGMIIADVQLRTEALGAKGWLIGLILASTFVFQVIFSPLWARIGDRTDRRTIFAICTLLSATGMLVYGMGNTLLVILISRIFSGLGAANVAMGQAIIASLTSEEERTREMGRLSAVMSSGLILGPALGGVIAEHWGSIALGWIAGGLSMVGFVAILLLVPKCPGTGEGGGGRKWSWAPALLRDFPKLRPFLVTIFITWFALALLEGTFARLIKANLGYGQQEFGFIFGWESLLGFVVSGVLLDQIVRRMGDEKAITLAFIFEGIGLGLTPLAPNLGALFLCSTFFALGTSVANPTVNSLMSKLVPETRHGELFGFIQSIRGVGFIAGPIIGGALFDLRHAAPYALAGAACMLAGAMVPEAKRDEG